ncbi:MAG: chorismate mutase [Nitrospiraceae bacterium]|nr:chorismate mutase [Nitrospiraceae bacterium]
MELWEIRQKIDKIDAEIIGLLSKRAELVTKAGKLKKDEQRVRDPKRVEQVINKVKSKATEVGLDPNIAEQIYRTIIGCFVAKELKEFRGGDAQPLFFSNSHLPTKEILEALR